MQLKYVFLKGVEAKSNLLNVILCIYGSVELPKCMVKNFTEEYLKYVKLIWGCLKCVYVVLNFKVKF